MQRNRIVPAYKARRIARAVSARLSAASLLAPSVAEPRSLERIWCNGKLIWEIDLSVPPTVSAAPLTEAIQTQPPLEAGTPPASRPNPPSVGQFPSLDRMPRCNATPATASQSEAEPEPLPGFARFSSVPASGASQ